MKHGNAGALARFFEFEVLSHSHPLPRLYRDHGRDFQHYIMAPEVKYNLNRLGPDDHEKALWKEDRAFSHTPSGFQIRRLTFHSE